MGAGEDPSDQSKRKNKKQRRPDSKVIATADTDNAKAPTGDTPNHIEKMWNGPCPNHRYPVRHLYKECSLMKRQSAKRDPKNHPDPASLDAEKEDDDGFPEPDGCLMIIPGPEAHGSRHRSKVERSAVFAAEPTTPMVLRWSDVPITFDRSDHPTHVPKQGRYPLVVDPIIRKKRVSKVLLDGGSGLNILYAKTLDAVGMDHASIGPTRAPLHCVVPGVQAFLIRKIDLPVTFGIPSNCQTEILTFEVVGFPRVYHAMLGRPSFVKFMVVSNYTYLKLKLLGPKGVITVGASFQHAY